MSCTKNSDNMITIICDLSLISVVGVYFLFNFKCENIIFWCVLI